MADAATASVSSTTPDVGRRYTYDSPEPYSFVRLLRLTSPVGASRIEGRLTTVLLPGPFTAISYTWGRGDTVERLWLGNGRYVPINESAGYVLRHMPRGGQIWIDSVCIDQENEAEKEWTIPNVHQVYMAAQQVNVWLGPPSEESEAAFGLLRAINDNVILSDELAELFAKAPPGSHIDEMVQLHRALGDSWVALADLLDSPWFTRCWIIQEIVHAEDVTVTCGREVISWAMLERTVREILTVPYLLRRLLQSSRPSCYACPESPEEDAAEGRGQTTTVGLTAELRSAARTRRKIPAAAHAIRHISYIRSLGREMSWSTLQWNLLFFADNKATNPVDRIQALLWVSYATLKQRDLPRPDVSAVETYTRLTGSMVRLNKEILALHMAGIGWPGGMADLPSWVPDYTMEHRRAFQSGRITILGRMTDTQFRAWNMVFHSIDANIMPEHSIWMLSLKGISVDTVGIVVRPPALTAGVWGAVNDGSPEERRSLVSWFDNLEVLLGRPGTCPKGHGPRTRRRLPEWQVLADLLVGGRSVWESRLLYSPSRTRLLQFSFARGADLTPIDGYKAFVAVLTRLRNHPGLTDPWANLDPDTREAAQIYSEALDDFSDWSVFRTRKGQLGRGPRLTETDDVICVFESARTPFLLRRPCSAFVHALTLWSTYHLVGEAYVNGWMERQAMFLPLWKQWWFHLV